MIRSLISNSSDTQLAHLRATEAGQLPSGKVLLLRGACVGVTRGTLQAEILHGTGLAFRRAVVVDDRAGKDASGEQRHATREGAHVQAELAELLVDLVDTHCNLRVEQASLLLDLRVHVLEAGVGLSSELRQMPSFNGSVP